MVNPFGEGRKPNNNPAGFEASADVGNLCPFLGIVPAPKIAPSLIQGGQPNIDVQLVMSPCQGPRCAFWDAAAENCSIKLAVEEIRQLPKLLEPLKNFFGSRG
jgi:hypothetical protein